MTDDTQAEAQTQAPVDAMDEARTALLREIARQVQALEGSPEHVNVTSGVVQRLALAYRYVAGGDQPGSDPAALRD